MARGYDGSIMFDTRVDTGGFNRGVRDINGGLSGLTSAFKKLGGVIAGAFVVKKLVDFGREAVALASDLQEVQNVVDTAFGDMSYMAEEFAKTAVEKFGMSELTAKQFTSTYMAMGKGIGMVSKEAAKMAIETAGRAGDIASFYNMQLSEADTMLKSIWTGETETLKRIGVVMTETNLKAFALSKGITKNLNAMAQAEKVQLRYAFVMDQTRLAMGDFAKTSDSWANQTRILTEQWKKLLGILGSGIMQAVTPAIKALNALMAKLIEFANLFSSVIGKVFGKKKETKMQMTPKMDTKGIESATDAENDLAKATKKAGKEIKNNTAAFDELNVLAQDSAKEGIGAGKDALAGAGGGFDFSEIEAETQKAEDEMSGFEKKLRKLLEPLKEINFNPLDDSLARLRESLKPFGQKIGEGLEWFYLNVLVPLSKWYIENVLPRFLEIFAGALDVLRLAIDKIKPLALFLFEAVLKPLAEWQGKNFIDNLNIANGVLMVFAGILEGDVKKGFDGFMQIIESAYNILRRVFVAFLGEEVVRSVENFAKKTAEIIADWWTNSVSPWFTKEVWLALFVNVNTAFTEIWNQIQLKSTQVYTAITSLWGKASGFFKKSVIDPTKNAFKDGINFMIGLAEGFVNRFIDGINKIIDAINSISFDMPKTLGGGHIGFSLARVAPVSIPRLATGAVIPPNGEFMAMLGDQKHGKNLEAPEELIRQIVKEETASSEITINFGGSMSQLVRLLKPHIEKENVRKGKCLVKGAPA